MEGLAIPGTETAAIEGARRADRPKPEVVGTEAGGVALEPLVSVVIPCLDEAAGISGCVWRARETLDAGGLSGEVTLHGGADFVMGTRLRGRIIRARCHGFTATLGISC